MMREEPREEKIEVGRRDKGSEWPSLLASLSGNLVIAESSCSCSGEREEEEEEVSL